MAFFTRSKSNIPVLPGEVDASDDEWDDELEERRTPDGRSSKTFYELRHRDAKAAEQSPAAEQPENAAEVNEVVEVVECKNPCLNEPCYENLPNEGKSETDETKTDEVRYEFVVDRVLGVQV